MFKYYFNELRPQRVNVNIMDMACFMTEHPLP